MDFTVKEIKEFKAAIYKKTFSFKNGENFKEIPLFWQEIMSNGKCDNLLILNNKEPKGVLGICDNFRENDFDYYIGVSTDISPLEKTEKINIKTNTYAAFVCEIKEIQETTKKIFEDFLPNSNYEIIKDTASLEIYKDEFMCEICVPIKNK